MKWIMLLWTSFVSFLIAIYAYAWRDMLKTKRVVDRTSTTFRFGLIAIVRATDLKRTNRSSFEVHRNALRAPIPPGLLGHDCEGTAILRRSPRAVVHHVIPATRSEPYDGVSRFWGQDRRALALAYTRATPFRASRRLGRPYGAPPAQGHRTHRAGRASAQAPAPRPMNPALKSRRDTAGTPAKGVIHNVLKHSGFPDQAGLITSPQRAFRDRHGRWNGMRWTLCAARRTARSGRRSRVVL
jgi:hypothetical protein